MTTTMKRDRARSLLTTTLEVRAEADLPTGVCGQVVGVALVYGVRDAYGTAFARRAVSIARSARSWPRARSRSMPITSTRRTLTSASFVDWRPLAIGK